MIEAWFGLQKECAKVTIPLTKDIMDIELAYQQALDYLYTFVDYSLTRQLRYTPEKFNLDRMRQLLDILGNPQQDFPVIHVAGTKGKGSTAAMISSACQSAGLRTGFYISPHLQDYCERIQIDRQPFPHEDLVAYLEEIKPAIQQVEQITTFEITTALAFLYFSRKKVDVGVIEVGLGGRLDATNVVEPLVSVITSLSMDHMAILGDTLGLIAREKAGIIKHGRPIVMAPQKEEARLVIEEVSRDRDARLVEVGSDILFAGKEHSLDGQTLVIWNADEQSSMDTYVQQPEMISWEPTQLAIPLLGSHQIENAVTAYAAIREARREGLKISEEAIRTGFAAVRWEGRFEIMSRSPMVVVDSAHNRDSAVRLRQALDDYLPNRGIILIFGASEDKDVDGMFTELMPRVWQVIATQSEHPRAMPAADIVDLAHRHGRPANAVLPVAAALDRALSEVTDDSAIIVAGSIFLAAAVREVWRIHNSLQKH